MGIVVRQGVYNTIFQYAGILTGFLNTIILYPRILSAEQIGAFNLLISLSLIFSQLSGLGINSVFQRFYPRFKSSGTDDKGFTLWIFLLSVVSFTFFSLLVVFFQGSIKSYLSLPTEIGWLYLSQTLILALLTLVMNLADVMARAYFKGLVTIFMRDFFMRLCVTILLGLLFVQVIDFKDFIHFYILLSILSTAVLLVEVFKIKKFNLRQKISLSKIEMTDMFKYGLFIIFAGSANVLIIHVDNVMLTNMKGLAVMGIYSIYFTVGAMISVPARGIGRIVYQLVIEFWQSKDIEKVKELYLKSSLTQLTIGIFIFMIGVINMDILLFIVDKPEFNPYYRVFYFIGFAYLIDCAGGLNLFIISISEKYIYGAYILTFSLVLCIISNYLLIPQWGAEGAAASFLLVYAVINISSSILLKYFYNIPSIKKMHVFLFLFLSCFCVLWEFKISLWNSIWIDSLIYSAITSIVFCLFVIYWNVIPEVNYNINKIIQKYKP
jgi:O-antigen/teichoic acid export membrane protein